MAAALHLPTIEALVCRLGAAGIDWEAVDSTGSTNADLMARARTQAPDRPLVRAANVQTAGRGRMGRRWLAPAGNALLFSAAIPWDGAPADGTAVTLAFGAAVAECLAAGGVTTSVKWPNDILLDGRKLAGILTELAADDDGRQTLIAGLGLNLIADEAQRVEIGQPVADLAECLGRGAVAGAREAWLVRLALALIGAAAEFRARGFAAFHARFERVAALKGEAVQVSAGAGAPIQGIMRGVDGLGRLLVECDDEIVTIMSGEMSLRTRR